jgi:formamidopyrimidine-DNA glycosylase
MPELPEVETTLRGLATFLDGATLASVQTRREGLRRPFPPDLAQVMTGATITSLSRRAKYGLLHTNRATTMVFHLGMSGRWRINPDALATHDHLILTTTTGHTLALNDARRFGSVDLVPTAALGAWGPFAALGPEPLGDALTPTHLAAHLAAHIAGRIAGRITPIKLLLLDQSVVAGLGNIYVCEALHRAHISPLTPGAAVPTARLAALVDAIRAVLSESIAAGGSTIRDYAQPNGELGYFAANWRVYGRAGQACLAPGCNGAIGKATQGGRSSFWCPVCQPSTLDDSPHPR